MKRCFMLAAMLAIFAGCADDGVVPTVEVLEITPDAIDTTVDAQNDVTIRLRYSDPDGDLGEGRAIITDCRGSDIQIEMDLPPIANGEAVDKKRAINGEVSLLLADVIAVERGASSACEGMPNATLPLEGEVSYCVQLEDSAGNVSDADCSGAVGIVEG